MFFLYIPLGYATDTAIYHFRQRRKQRAAVASRPMDVRMFTVGPVPENCFLFRRDGSDRALIVDPGDEAPKLLGAIERARRRRSRRSCSPTRTSTTWARWRRSPKATGAEVWVPEIEKPVLADIMSFVPWPGFGPFESYDAEHTLERRREARAGRLRDRRAVHARPQPRPRDLLDPRRGRRCSPATCCSRARSAAPTCPAATGRTLLESIRTLVDALPDETTVYPGHMGVTTLGAERATNPFLAELAPLSGSSRPRGARSTCCPRTARRACDLLATARRACSAARGYGHIETPVFEDTELFARGVGESTDIVQKEMFTFEDKGGRSLTLRPEGTAGVCRAYVEHGMHKLPAAGEALVLGPVLPPRGARRPAASASSPRSAPRRSAPTTRRSTPS